MRKPAAGSRGSPLNRRRHDHTDKTVNGCPCDWELAAEGGSYVLRIFSESSAARLGLKEGDTVQLTYCDTEIEGTIGELVKGEGRHLVSPGKKPPQVGEEV